MSKSYTMSECDCCGEYFKSHKMHTLTDKYNRIRNYCEQCYEIYKGYRE